MKKAHQQQNKLWPELTSSGVWHTLHRGHGEKEYWAVLIALPLTVIVSSWLHIRLCTVPGRRHPFSCCLLVNTQEETLTQLWLYLLLCLSRVWSDLSVKSSGTRAVLVFWSHTVLTATEFFLSCSLDLLFCNWDSLFFVQPNADLEKRLLSFFMHHSLHSWKFYDVPLSLLSG